MGVTFCPMNAPHDDVIKWKHFPRNWPFVRGIYRSRWIPHTKASVAELWFFCLICIWINVWVSNLNAGYLRRYRGHYDVIVMTRSAEGGNSLSLWRRDFSTHREPRCAFIGKNITPMLVRYKITLNQYKYHIIPYHTRNTRPLVQTTE